MLYQIEHPKPIGNLTPYQEAVARTIMFELDALYTAAKVVQTDMVTNSAVGIVGSIGSLFGMLSPYIPIVGPAVGLFSTFLTTYDTSVQAKIALNIAKLALTSGKASELIEKIAIEIAKSNINLSNLPKEDITTKIMSAINVVQDIQATAMNALVDFIVSKIEIKEVIDDEMARGESDGQAIASILIAYISTGQCKKSTNWHSNYKILEQYLIDNHFIEIPVVQLNILRLTDNLQPDVQVALEIDNGGDTQDSADNTVVVPISNNVNPDNINLALAGGSLMKTMEVWPAIKYLATNWIPIIPIMKDYGLTSEFLSKYEYEVCTGLHIAGGLALTYAAQASPYYAVASGLIYAVKPHIYMLENKLLSFIMGQENTNGYVKFALYASTEATLSAVSLSFVNKPMIIIELLKYPANLVIDPIAFINDPAIQRAFVQGAFMGSIKYFDNFNIKEGNIIGDTLAFSNTGLFFYSLSGKLEQFPHVGGKIMVTATSISIGANVHYISKVAGDFIGEQFLAYAGYDSNLNSTAIDLA